MGLETVTHIGDLNALWPLGGDSRRQGDDHLRALKTAVQTTIAVEHGTADGKHKFSYGAFSARPAAGSSGWIYFDTTNQILWLDNGTSWLAFGAGKPELGVIKNSGSTSLTQSSYTQVDVDTAIIDTFSMLDATNNALKVITAGTFFISASVAVTGANSAGEIGIYTGATIGGSSIVDGMYNDLQHDGSTDEFIGLGYAALSVDDLISLWFRTEGSGVSANLARLSALRVSS